VESVERAADGDGVGPDVLRETVALRGDEGCIAQARHRAAAFLERARSERGIPVSDRAGDLTRLVVSELVTNALKYAPGPVLMELRIDGSVVEIVVWDSDPRLPTAKPADPGRVGQHGLEIVTAVCQEFDARRTPLGKRVMARLSLSGTPGGASTGP
jgi:anti-sigma regulatory factor (Ser/Thr protein kinase)